VAGQIAQGFVARPDEPDSVSAGHRGLNVPLPAGRGEVVESFLAWRDQPFRKTHDLEELAHLCVGLARLWETQRAVLLR